MIEDMILNLLASAGLAVEEAISWLGEKPSIGDDGVAEALVRAENALVLASGKIRKRQEAS